MIKFFKKITATVLAICMVVTSLQAYAVAAAVPVPPEKLEITADNYITASVSTSNGGFLIDTKKGDKLEKNDDNKFLLYPDEYYESSYTSFRITKNGEEPIDVIFGREYPEYNSEFLGTTQNGNQITTQWKIGSLLFTQLITVLNTDSPAHGMVEIAYNVQNLSEDKYDVKARVLLDSSLGYQDYAFYKMPEDGANIGGNIKEITTECVLDNTNEKAYQNAFFAYDNPASPNIRAYTVNANIGDKTVVPTKVAFGHWNNLASTIYDFTPNTALDFTSPYNLQNMIADSAYALYFDFDAVGAFGDAQIATNYGVFSNAKVSGNDSVALTFTKTPPALVTKETTDNSIVYENNGDFEVSFQVKKLADEDFSNATIEIVPDAGINPYNSDGELDTTQNYYKQPYVVPASNFNSDGLSVYNFKFKATPDMVSAYREIKFTFVNGVETITESVFVLCPGHGFGEVTINNVSPAIIYKEGEQNLTISGAGFNLLKQKSQYNLVLTSNVTGQKITVEPEKFTVDDTENVIVLELNQKLDLGEWEITIDYIDKKYDDIHNSAMLFNVSNDQKYLANSYGVITIEREGNTEKTANQYSIKTYADEDEYNKLNKNQNNLTLLAFRGNFIATKEGDKIVEVKGVSSKDNQRKIKNVMTINNCIDVSDGVITISDKDDVINVFFDAKLTTTNANTEIWDGVCAITAIEDGTYIELTQYDYSGENIGGDIGQSDISTDNTASLTLVWPGAASKAQTLSGVLLELRYGQFGMMATERTEEVDENTPKVPVLAFGAQLSPNILVPSTKLNNAMKMSVYEQKQMALTEKPGFNAYEVLGLRDKYQRAQEEYEENANGSLGLYVNDILFGGGFIGFNTSVEVGIPSYAEGLPEIEGTLNLKVMNSEWAFRVDGKADFGVMIMEASIGLKSYEGIPITDNIYFFCGGFAPGINVDGFGVFWVKGAGGGFENLYDTLFGQSKIPPLSLLISGEFSLFSILSMRADLALSLREFSANITDVGLAMGSKKITLIKELGLSATWYPELRFYGGINISILDAIVGQGYIILEETDDDFFWEGFARATLKVPDNIVVIGGLTLASLDVGVNPEKIWAAAEVIKINFGVTYYWGGDVNFGFGKYDTPQPTYGDLLRSAPYMTLANAPVLMSTQRAVPLATNSTNTVHNFTLDKTYSDKEDVMAVLNFTADTKEQAVDIAKSIVVKSGTDVRTIELQIDTEENENANAMLRTTEQEDGTIKASVIYSFTEEEDFAPTRTTSKNISFTSSTLLEDSSLETFSIERLPELESVSYTNKTATVVGELNNFESINIYAENESGIYLLAEETVTEDKTSKDFALTMPVNMPSGEYTIKAVASDKAKKTNPIVEATSKLNYTNPNQPNNPNISGAVCGGDYTIDVNTSASGNFDGYIVNVYNEDGSLTDITNYYIAKDAVENGVITVGGQYTACIDPETNEPSTNPEHNKTYGLFAGKNYKVGVATYNEVMPDPTDPETTIAVKSSEIMSSAVTMVEPKKTDINLSINNSKNIYNNAFKYDCDTINISNPVINISTENGTLRNAMYSLDDGELITLTDLTKIPLSDLNEGTHTIHVQGENDTGDSTHKKYVFAIDKTAPKVLLSSHAGSALFSSNTVTLEGICEENANIKVYVEGKLVKTIPVSNADGSFAIPVSLDDTLAYQYVTICATDSLGNQSDSCPISFVNSNLGTVKPNYSIYLDDKDITNTIINNDVSGKLSVKVKSDEGKLITINSDSLVCNNKIEWQTNMRSGSVTLENNKLSVAGENIQGVLTAKFNGNILLAAIDTNKIEDNASIDQIIVDNAKSIIVDGAVTVPYGSGQITKTNAVQTYVENILDNANIDVTGVIATVSHKTDNIYEVTVSKGSVTEKIEITVIVTEEEIPDELLVNNAFDKANNATYNDVTGTESFDSEPELNAYILNIAKTKIDNNNILTSVKGTYIAPIHGTKSKPTGTNGSYEFTVTVKKGSSEKTTSLKSIAIHALPYVDVTDKQLLSIALAKIQSTIFSNVNQSSSYDSANKLNDYIKNIATTAVGNNLIKIKVNGTFTPAVAGTSTNPIGTNGTYVYTITLEANGFSVTSAEMSIDIIATKFNAEETPETGDNPNTNMILALIIAICILFVLIILKNKFKYKK